ncbi:helix-turn-helix domain-containing protein [Lentilactobacillus raoultii]|uniref:Helix-turn-helix domain-containing protein n=1 Tax=Lentilactobacillus raoultii TaxID=1987503 RepID=A0ABW3PM78_9LACO|nr:helix-turn-helix transcriptional regulator [Lentilactobacillus raoultii]
MKFMQFELSNPVKFIQSGHFSADVGWQHAVSTRKKDTEILIGTANETQVRVNDTPYTLNKGSVLCVFPGETIAGTAPTTEKVEFTWLHFMNQAPISSLDNYPKDFKQLTSVILPRYFKLTNPNRIFALTAQLLDVTHMPNPSLVSIDYFVSFYLSELANDYQQSINQSSYEEGIVNKIKEWVRTTVNTDLKVADIAVHFKMNKDYMARLFKRVTGMTIKAYINQSKINLARYLLLTTDLSVRQIAEKCFFSDYKYFFRIFKSYTSLTPLKYRNTFTNTFLNNPAIDPGYDVGKIVSLLEKGLDESTIY